MTLVNDTRSIKRTAAVHQAAYALALAVMIAASLELQGGVIFTNLVTFNCANGAEPRGALLLSENGHFYGSTMEGGAGDENNCLGGGTVFQLTASGYLTTLATMGTNDGGQVNGPLARGGDGLLYGVTYFGGAYIWGTVFRLSASNTITTLYEFSGPDGVNPAQGLVRGADGNLYGTTYWGGESNTGGQTGYGTVFRITTNGMFRLLHSFNLTNGNHPWQLTLGREGNLYGTTMEGGTYSELNPDMSLGTVFRLSSNGVFTSLFSFNGTNGFYPLMVSQGNDGSLYGTTMGGGSAYGQSGGLGTVFRLTLNGELTTLHEFSGGMDGGYPWGQLERGTDDCFYGTTGSGGTNGQGTFFRITTEGLLTTLYAFGSGQTGGPVKQGSDGRFYVTAPLSGPFENGNIYRLSVPIPPVFQAFEKHGDMLNLTWSSVAEQTYQLQYVSELNATNWTSLGSAIAATNGTTTVSDAVSDGKRFYRVVLLP